jgi:methylthioribulose-1-phosphate dehydratase
MEVWGRGISMGDEELIKSSDPEHPANLICSLCRNFYHLGWVTGTGGGVSIVRGSHIFIAPSGLQKELLQPEHIFVMEKSTRAYLRKPIGLKPSACTPLFLAAFDRGAGSCIHTHSQWAVLVTLLVERDAVEQGQKVEERCFEIERIEQIKAFPKGRGKAGMLGYFDRLQVPIIENTAQYVVIIDGAELLASNSGFKSEEDLTHSLEMAMEKYPDAYAVLVRRHGV